MHLCKLAVAVGRVVRDLAKDLDLRRNGDLVLILRHGRTHNGALVGEGIDVDLKAVSLVPSPV